MVPKKPSAKFSSVSQRLRRALLVSLAGLMLLSSVLASQVATAAAWRELFAQSICSSGIHDESNAAHHAACEAHCTAACTGHGGASAPPRLTHSFVVPALYRVALHVATFTHDTVAPYALPTVRAPPILPA